MAVIDKKVVMAALQQALIFVILTPLILLIPLLGPLLLKLPTFTISVVQLSLAQLVAGTIALIVGNLVLAKLKK